MKAVNGVATFATLTLNRSGTGYTLNAYAPGLRGATSVAFNVGAGPAAQLGFLVQPSQSGAGLAMSPAVQVVVEDAAGTTAPTATNSVTLAIGANPGGATLSGTTAVAAVGGIATFSTLSLDKTGTGYTLVVSAAGLTGATSP
ncbi:MAG TPA: hypothetical protein VN786_05995, partial [Acidimicrobiales bacterium]|nr:hypothetical protein [Acidimicrobiales bacterium]